MPPPVLDNFGRVMSEAPPDKWPARSGIALALRRMSPSIGQNEIESLFEFFVKQALSDRNEIVRQTMLDAAVTCINDHGKVLSLLYTIQIAIDYYYYYYYYVQERYVYYSFSSICFSMPSLAF